MHLEFRNRRGYAVEMHSGCEEEESDLSVRQDFQLHTLTLISACILFQNVREDCGTLIGINFLANMAK